jgi:hypothetical protein
LGDARSPASVSSVPSTSSSSSAFVGALLELVTPPLQLVDVGSHLVDGLVDALFLAFHGSPPGSRDQVVPGGDGLKSHVVTLMRTDGS